MRNEAARKSKVLFKCSYAPKEAQDITTAEIEAYLVHLVRIKHIAPSTQNQIINAIKF